MEENTLRQVKEAVDVILSLRAARRTAEEEYTESIARITDNGQTELLECAVKERKVMSIIDAILEEMPASGWNYFKRLKDIV